MVPSAGYRVPIPGHSFRVTQGVSFQGADSLLLGTGPLSRIQGPIPGHSFPSAGHRVPLSVRSVPSAGPFPGYRVPSPEHRFPPPGTPFPTPGAVSSLMGTGLLPGVQGPLRGHNLLSERRTVGSPRRSASHADAAPPGADEPSWTQPPPAAQRIQVDRGPPSARRPGCASDPAARRGPEPGSIGSGVGGQVRGRRRCAASATCPALT